MTMTSILMLLLVPAVLVVGLWVFAWFSQRELDRLQKLEAWNDEFVKSVRDLLEDADVPSDVAQSLDTLNEIMSSSQSVNFLVRLLRNIDQKRRTPPSSLGRDDDPVCGMRPELAQLFGVALLAGLMTISYQSRFTGWAIRAKMAELFIRKDRRKATSTVARALVLGPQQAAI